MINRGEGCGFGGEEPDESLWVAHVEQSEDEVQLKVEWNFESPNACGGCVDDFSVKLKKVASNAKLRLEIDSRPCVGVDCQWSTDTITLPIGTEASGIRCRYLRAGWTSMLNAQWSPGKLHLPRADGTCDAALVATDIAGPGNICVAPCTEDSDCPLQDLLACHQGTCQLAHPWK